VIVLGDREISEGTVSVRVRGTKEARSLSRPEFLALVGEKIRRRDFDP
jgi:threonyl-tRNA synthetase